MLVLRRIGFHAGVLLITLALPRLAAADCKTEPIHPCGDANKGECMLCSCSDGKQYSTIRYAEAVSAAEVHKKIQQSPTSKEAAATAATWLGAKHARLVDRSPTGGGEFNHKYCWMPLKLIDLPLFKKSSYLDGEFYDGQCVPPTPATCVLPTVECTKRGSAKEFTCAFRVNEFHMKGDSCKPEDSAHCPDLANPEGAKGAGKKKGK
jgi:hypothetical protein